MTYRIDLLPVLEMIWELKGMMLRNTARADLKSGFLRETMQLGLGRGLGKVLSFLGFLLVARAVGPEEYGGLTFALSVGSLLAFIPNMGVDPYYSREVPPGREEPSQLLGIILPLKLAGSVVFMVVYLGILFGAHASVSARSCSVMIGLALSFLALGQTTKTVLITEMRGGYAGALEVVAAVIFAGCGISVFLGRGGIRAAAGGFLTGQAIALLAGAAMVWRSVGCPVSPRVAEPYLRILRKTFPFVLIWLVSDLYFRIDTTILNYLRGDRETGVYGASYRLIEGVNSATLIICSTALPRLARAWKDGVDKFLKEWKRALRLEAVVVGLPGVVLSLAAPQLIKLLFGPRFSESASSLRILGLSTPVLGIGSIYAIALTTIGLEWNQFYITSIALLANVILNLLWIPEAGSVGAAMATLISAFGFWALAHIFMFRGLRSKTIDGAI